MSEPRHSLRCHNLEPAGPEALQLQGALIKVNITVMHGDRRAALARQAGVQAVLMIDTGATGTLVRNEILEKIGLPRDRTGLVHGVAPWPVECPFYRLAVDIPMVEDKTGRVHRIVFPAEIGGLPTHEGRYDYYMGLLGRDVLSALRLDYAGPEGLCHLHLERPTVRP